MTRALRVAAVLLLPVAAQHAAAQSVRGRVDASAQAVSFRGLKPDSAERDSVVTTPSGGFESPEGFAVRCGAGAFCAFLRPGPVRRALPLTATASAVAWGLGVEGLSLHASARLIADISGSDVWPGASPFAQLLEGFAEYTRSYERGTLRARGGRQLLTSRLEPMGFDGAWANVRLASIPVEGTLYAGWGLGQASALPVSSPALNPLDEWRPRQRQWVVGGDASWSNEIVDVRGEYRREIDPEDHNFVSERAAVSAVARLPYVRVNASFDYNIAEGRFGSADLTGTYAVPRYSASMTVRRYRPYFSLWTLWGAFSPAGYDAINASGRYELNAELAFRARVERYWYDNADVSTQLVTGLKDRGWRSSASVTATVNPRWTLDGTAGYDAGPGASGSTLEASADYAKSATLTVGGDAGVIQRPLELRFYDATSRWIGVHASWQATQARRVWGDLAFVGDDRSRPDAGSSSMDQVRLRAGASLTFGRGADRVPLPPARPQR
ncbi:MAG TPA: hypothetical protein VE967_06225 [Gemmatimonadaceae bacterium]|nr:hypothetical protein [Gemmatimonadaceae bacterium]